MGDPYNILPSQIEDYQTNGSGWVLAILLDVKTMLVNALDHHILQVEGHQSDEEGE